MSWNGIAERWGSAPAVSSVGARVDPELCFAVVRAICEPFGRGSRHHALPAVVFEADGDRIPVAGELLPDAGDVSAAGYRERIAASAGEWRLRVVEPLFTDYRLWSVVRDLVGPLWEAVGVPVLPVASELVLASGGATAYEAESTALSLVVVCDGVAELRAGADVRLLGVGDVAHLPAGSDAAVRAGESCLLLRLGVSMDRRAPTAEAFRLLSGLVAADAAAVGEPVPELPFPPVATESGELKAPFPPEVVERPPHRADFRAEAERLTQLWWVGRVSAAALDPVPAPAEPPGLRPGDALRLIAPVVVVPGAGPDRWLWAANGMAFTVAGPVPGRVLGRLRGGDPVLVAELCRDEDGDDNGALPLLDRLHALRAVEIVEETAS